MSSLSALRDVYISVLETDLAARPLPLNTGRTDRVSSVTLMLDGYEVQSVSGLRITDRPVSRPNPHVEIRDLAMAVVSKCLEVFPYPYFIAQRASIVNALAAGGVTLQILPTFAISPLQAGIGLS